MQLPPMRKILCRYRDEHIADIQGALKSELEGTGIRFETGAQIAIATGSRGISNIKEVIREIALWVKRRGGQPFVAPAMGSHGGATAKGQRQVLESYGITEAYVGAPIRSSMEVVELERDGLENRIFMDKYAYQADGIIVVNRVKVHTDFHGTTESGIVKMCVLGLGNHKQALEIHSYGLYGLKTLISKTAKRVIEQTNILLGVALVENAYDQTMAIRAVKPEDFEAEEAGLLAMNRENMPGIPVRKIDILIVDEMGKDISGVGMDTNVIGRMKIRGEADGGEPDIANILALDLTDASHGNAVGMGLADFITRRLYEKIDFRATYENILTSTFTERGKTPIIAATDEQAVRWAIRVCGKKKREDIRIVRIKNTLRLGEMYLSENLLEEARSRADIEETGVCALSFDESGTLCKF